MTIQSHFPQYQRRPASRAQLFGFLCSDPNLFPEKEIRSTSSFLTLMSQSKLRGTERVGEEDTTQEARTGSMDSPITIKARPRRECGNGRESSWVTYAKPNLSGRFDIRPLRVLCTGDATVCIGFLDFVAWSALRWVFFWTFLTGSDSVVRLELCLPLPFGFCDLVAFCGRGARTAVAFSSWPGFFCGIRTATRNCGWETAPLVPTGATPLPEGFLGCRGLRTLLVIPDAFGPRTATGCCFFLRLPRTGSCEIASCVSASSVGPCAACTAASCSTTIAKRCCSIHRSKLLCLHFSHLDLDPDVADPDFLCLLCDVSIRVRLCQTQSFLLFLERFFPELRGF